MICKREKMIIDTLGKARLFADGEPEDIQVTVFEFEDKKPQKENKAEEIHEKVAEAAKGEEKKPAGKKSTALIIALVIAGLILGFGAGYGITAGVFAMIDAQEKDFTAGNMTITLNQSFEQYNLPRYAAVYASGDVEVFVTKTNANGSSAADYAQAIIDVNHFNTQLVSEGDLNYFIHSSTEDDGNLYQNYYFAYKSGKDFWLVQFSVLDKNANKYDASILKWAGSVEFN